MAVPSESRESFAILTLEKIVDAELGARLQKMLGFRSLAVHRYRELDMPIVEAVIRTNLDDFLRFADTMRSHLDDGP